MSETRLIVYDKYYRQYQWDIKLTLISGFGHGDEKFLDTFIQRFFYRGNSVIIWPKLHFS